MANPLEALIGAVDEVLGRRPPARPGSPAPAATGALIAPAAASGVAAKQPLIGPAGGVSTAAPGGTPPIAPGPAFTPAAPAGGAVPFDPNAGKPSILRRILAGAAGGLEGFEGGGTKGAELGQKILNAPRERYLENLDLENKQREGQKPAPLIAPAAAQGGAPDAAAQDAENAARSLGAIQSDVLRGGGRTVYGGPTPEIAPAAPVQHGKVVDRYTDNGGHRVEVYEDGFTRQEPGLVQEKVPAARTAGRSAGRGAAPRATSPAAVIQVEKTRDAELLKAEQMHRGKQIDDAGLNQMKARAMGNYAESMRRLGQTPTADTPTAQIYFLATGSKEAAISAMKKDGWVVPNE